MITIIGFNIENILTRTKITSEEVKLMDGLSWVIVVICLVILFSNPISVFLEICLNYRAYLEKMKRCYFWVLQKLCGYESNQDDCTNQSSMKFLNDSFSKNYQSSKLNNTSFLRNPKNNNLPLSLFDI